MNKRKDLLKIENYVNLALKININEKTRKRRIVDGRFLFFAIARKSTDLSLQEIGNHLNKDHATALHGVNKFNDVLMIDKRFERLYSAYVFENWTDPSVGIEMENKDLIKKNYKLQKEISILKTSLKEKYPFLDGYYKLTEAEKQTVKERLSLIIRLMPSNQVKRKQVSIN